ncbi:MAG TPA: hypothetical protein PKC20_08320 [Burkholderiaceae bacterium]|nr:hypothetical protein [Burkholderiaceae bacterium]
MPAWNEVALLRAVLVSMFRVAEPGTEAVHAGVTTLPAASSSRSVDAYARSVPVHLPVT